MGGAGKMCLEIGARTDSLVPSSDQDEESRLARVSSGNSQTLTHLQHLWLILFVHFSILLCRTCRLPRITLGQKDDYKLTVDVRLVGILVTVTTEDGALVATLKQEDFQVFENGKPQTIALFSKESEQPLRAFASFLIAPAVLSRS
jgi:hypothetical protein